MPRLKARSLTLFLGTGALLTYLAISLLSSGGDNDAANNVLSVLRQIYNANESVLPEQSTVLLEPSAGLSCHDRGSGLYLLFIVISSPENVERRQVIRSTFHEMRHQWENHFFQNVSSGGYGSNATRVFQMLFFTGQTQYGISDELRSEWEVHGDVIVDDMRESYLNLTVKTLRMLKWVLHHCGGANFLVKMDDDVFLNVPKLFSYLGSVGNPLLVAGHRYNEVNVDRDRSSKWYTPLGIWHRPKFPVFVAGFCYVMGMKAVEKMFEESRHVPLFHLEDVYISGIIGTDRLHLELSQLGDIVTMLYWYHYTKPLSWLKSKMIIHGVSSNQFQCWTKYTMQDEDGFDYTGEWWPLIFYCL